MIQATGNPLTCADLARARENASITIIFDSECLPSGDSDTGGVEGTIDDFSYRHPDRDYAAYHYALSFEARDYPYDLNSDAYIVSGFGGGSGSTFVMSTAEGDVVLSDPFDYQQITELWAGTSGTLNIRQGSGGGVYAFRVESSADKAIVKFNPFRAFSMESFVQEADSLKVSRPIPGTVAEQESLGQDCAYLSLEGFSTLLAQEPQLGIYFSDSVRGGTLPLFEYSPGEGAIAVCADTPEGISDVEVAVLDGRGGKKLFNLRVEVLSARVTGGSLEWDLLGSVPSDSDDDGVTDDSDAFPNDPAASVDTDGDGKPDDWNDGKSAAKHETAAI